MLKYILPLSLLSTLLFAEPDNDVSVFLIDQDVKEIYNESAYGKSSTYSLLFAKHQFSVEDEGLQFFYGAKMGVVSEEYTAENGFGIPLNRIGAYYAAAVGMEYTMGSNEMLLAEGMRAEDQHLGRTENRLQLTYTYSY